MPKSPNVNFTIENNNVEQTTPQLGISMVLARTQKGPFMDPSKVITSITEFKREFGAEIVPDGSSSNIEKALSLGSKLRIIRVPGAGYYKGYLFNTNTEVPTPAAVAKPTNVLTIGTDASHKVVIGFWTKTYDQTFNGVSTFDVRFYRSDNTIFYEVKGKGQDVVLESGPVFTYKNADSLNKTSVDYLQLNNFLRNSNYLEAVVNSSTITDVSSIDHLINYLAKVVDGSTNTLGVVDIATKGDLSSGTKEWTCEAVPGSSGTNPTMSNWEAAAESIRDYSDMYQVICSHIHQHLSSASDQYAVHKYIKQIAEETQDFMYYIEVPKYKSGTTDPKSKDEIIDWRDSCVGTIGNSMWVAYFAAGIKYFNDYGVLDNSDVLGSIIGLGDTTASKYGPWLSFSGMNRGLLTDAHGPVSPNYGSAGRYNDLNELAGKSINMIVIRDTANLGKQTMLWHGFTSQVKQDSFKFISIVRLVLYLKKFLRPILESYIEEPNIWSTWNDIYFRVKPELDRLVEVNAMSEYTWNGDQFATSYSDLVINNEADVRQGKYKVVLKFKDVVPMQEINITLSIDSAANVVTAIVGE